MDKLRLFNGDKQTKEEVLNFLIDYFQDKIIERAMEKKNVESLADAIIEVRNAFNQLDINYAEHIKQKPPTNTAR